MCFRSLSCCQTQVCPGSSWGMRFWWKASLFFIQQSISTGIKKTAPEHHATATTLHSHVPQTTRPYRGAWNHHRSEMMDPDICYPDEFNRTVQKGIVTRAAKMTVSSMSSAFTVCKKVARAIDFLSVTGVRSGWENGNDGERRLSVWNHAVLG